MRPPAVLDHGEAPTIPLRLVVRCARECHWPEDDSSSELEEREKVGPRRASRSLADNASGAPWHVSLLRKVLRPAGCRRLPSSRAPAAGRPQRREQVLLGWWPGEAEEPALDDTMMSSSNRTKASSSYPYTSYEIGWC